MKKKCLHLILLGLVIHTTLAQDIYLEKIWETDSVFSRPESVVYDSQRQRLYVSNYNGLPKQGEIANDFISIISLDGEILKKKWITGLRAPTGLLIESDYLYIVERDGISKYDIKSKTLIEKMLVEKPGFLNDISSNGTDEIYFSDTSFRNPKESTISKIRNGQIEMVVKDSINSANGLLFEKGHLIVGNSGSRLLTKVEIGSNKIVNNIQLEKGIIDGIKRFDENNYLVSHWEGRLFLVSDNGQVFQLLNTSNDKMNIADFEYINELKLIIIPTYLGMKVTAYKIKKNNYQLK